MTTQPIEEHSEAEHCSNCGKFIEGKDHNDVIQKQGYSFGYCTLCTNQYLEHKEADENEPTEVPAGMIKVLVKEIQVRHKGRTYKPGMALYIEADHFNSKIFEKADERAL